MKITYDKRADALYISIKENTDVDETEEIRPDLFIDKDKSGSLLGIEILGVSKQIPAEELKNIKFEVA